MTETDPNMLVTSAPVGIPESMQPAAADVMTEKKGAILKRLIHCDKQARSSWLEKGREINKFAFALDQDREIDALNPDPLSDPPFQARLSKGFQFICIIGWQVYQQNQERVVRKRKGFNDTQNKGPDTTGDVLDENQLRAKLMEDYLNFIPGEYQAEAQKRRAISEACIYGMGILESGWDSKRNIAISSHVHVEDYLIDSDATCEADCHRKSVKRYKPRWWLKKNYPQSEKMIDALPITARKPSDGEENKRDYSADTIMYYDMFLDIGLHNYKDGKELLDTMGVGDDSPRRYLVTEDGQIIADLPWSVPLHRSNKWPFTEYRMIDNPAGYYPMQPMLAGLPQLKAMDWMYKCYLSKMRFAVNTAFIAVTDNGNDLGRNTVDALMGTGLVKVLPWVNKGEEGKKASDLLQQITLDAGIKDLELYLQINSQEFEKAVGLYDILYTGGGERQMRTTTEAKFRQTSSTSRIEEFRHRIDDTESELASKEAQIARFLSTQEDIARIFGPERAQLWGFVMPPLQERINTNTMGYSDQGAPPEQAQQLGTQDAMAQQASDAAKGGYEFDKWVMENEFTVVAGSSIRKDKQAELDAYRESANSLWPSMMQAQSTMVQAAAMRGLKEYYEQNGAGDPLLNTLQQVIDMLMQPPPPPQPQPGPQPAPGEPPGGPPQPGAQPQPAETPAQSNAAVNAALSNVIMKIGGPAGTGK
jgi:hypothetical protein